MSSGNTFTIYVETKTSEASDHGTIETSVDTPEPLSPQTDSPRTPQSQMFSAPVFSPTATHDNVSSSEEPLHLRDLKDIYDTTDPVEMQYSSL